MNQVINRRSIIATAPAAVGVAGLVVVGAGEAAAAPAPASENPELLRLADQFQLALEACEGALEKVEQIKAEWTPRWPLAPESIWHPDPNPYSDFAHEVEKGFTGEKLFRQGEREAIELYSLKYIANVVQHWKQKKPRRLKQLAQKEEALQHWGQIREALEAYHAEKERVLAASGIGKANSAVAAAKRHLSEVLENIMHEDAVTVSGLLIKAEAIEAFSRQASWGEIWFRPNQEFRSLGRDLATSIRRLAGTDDAMPAGRTSFGSLDAYAIGAATARATLRSA